MNDRTLLSLVDPSDSCQDMRCSRIDGKCVGIHCGRCGEPSSSQGHYTSMCRLKGGQQRHHFCCPNGECDLDGPDEAQEKRAAADWPAMSVETPADGDHV